MLVNISNPLHTYLRLNHQALPSLDVRPGATPPDTYHTSISSKVPQRLQTYPIELDAPTEIPTRCTIGQDGGLASCNGSILLHSLLQHKGMTLTHRWWWLVPSLDFVIATMISNPSLVDMRWKDDPALVAQFPGTGRAVDRRSSGRTVGGSSPCCNPGCNQWHREGVTTNC